MYECTAPRPFMTIKDAAKYTGLSYKYIRNGCLKGEIAYVPNGRVYMVNMPLLFESLNTISKEEAEKNKEIHNGSRTR